MKVVLHHIVTARQDDLPEAGSRDVGQAPNTYIGIGANVSQYFSGIKYL